MRPIPPQADQHPGELFAGSHPAPLDQRSPRGCGIDQQVEELDPEVRCYVSSESEGGQLLSGLYVAEVPL